MGLLPAPCAICANNSSAGGQLEQPSEVNSSNTAKPLSAAGISGLREPALVEIKIVVMSAKAILMPIAERLNCVMAFKFFVDSKVPALCVVRKLKGFEQGIFSAQPGNYLVEKTA
jgi:hypothetical protein